MSKENKDISLDDLKKMTLEQFHYEEHIDEDPIAFDDKRFKKLSDDHKRFLIEYAKTGDKLESAKVVPTWSESSRNTAANKVLNKPLAQKYLDSVRKEIFKHASITHEFVEQELLDLLEEVKTINDYKERLKVIKTMVDYLNTFKPQINNIETQNISINITPISTENSTIELLPNTTLSKLDINKNDVIDINED